MQAFRLLNSFDFYNRIAEYVNTLFSLLKLILAAQQFSGLLHEVDNPISQKSA